MKTLSNTKTQSTWGHISKDIIRAYSIPLILGVLVALLVANVVPHWYEYWIEEHMFFGKFTFAWFVENVFMVLFFGTAGIEIVHALSPGGALNPIKKAVTPLMATLGVVLPSFVIILLIASVFTGLMKYAGVKDLLGGIKPAVIGLILGTAVTMLLGQLLGVASLDSISSPDLLGLAIFAIIAAVAITVGRVRKKPISPIILILLSGVLGVIFYGV